MTKLADQASDLGPVQWAGAYHPAYRLAPALLEAGRSPRREAWVAVTVQFYTTKALDQTLAKLTGMGGKLYRQPSRVLGFTSISLQVRAGQLFEIAHWPEVFDVRALGRAGPHG